MREMRADEQHAAALRAAVFEMLQTFDRARHACERTRGAEPGQREFDQQHAEIAQRSAQQ